MNSTVPLGYLDRVTWDRFALAVTSRRSWVWVLLAVVAAGALMGLAGANDSASQSPVSLPSSAESARAAELAARFPGDDRAPAILVLTRADGGALTPDDRAAADGARQRIAAAPLTVSDDGEAALAVAPLDSGLSGFALNDTVKSLRAKVSDGLPDGLTAQITGGPAFGADIANAFSGANVTLLAVTASVVAVLLILTYRSPVLWLVPLLVIAVADRVGAVAGERVTAAAGLTADGSTAGITSVLVFGAGTNYALLLISRYREELRRGKAGPPGRACGFVDDAPGESRIPHVQHASDDHRAALRTAVRTAGPAIVASNATVVLALLTLLFASAPSTRSLGLQAATGLVVAAVFALVVLPPLLALCGVRLFWPFIPRPTGGDEDAVATGVWHRIATAVARRPGWVAATSVALLAVLATGLFATPIGLSQTEQFRVTAESVSGYEAVAAHFPGGLTDPTRVIGSADRAAQLQQAITGTPGVVSGTESGRTDAGLVQFSVVTDAAPATDQAFEIVAALRDSIHNADPSAVVGGADAQALDTRDAAVRDRLVLIPAILAVVLAVLLVLLRSVVAPLILVAVTVLSALAALGMGGWVSVHLFGFPALDNSTPLFAFLFLVALGVDYTIFLVTRAREETRVHGTRDGIVRAVSATGAVITSAGIVLAAVFCVLGVLPLIVLTQLGIIVGLGILLDTFLVRTVVIPAIFTIIGPKVWWPSDIEPSYGRHARR